MDIVDNNAAVTFEGDGDGADAASQDIEQIHKMLNKIHDRSLGYAFGGPNKGWCVPLDQKSMSLHRDANDPGSPMSEYSGCRKYHTCNIIPDSLKWKSWDDLSEDERNILKKFKCYRATRWHWDDELQKPVERKISYWDNYGLTSRNSSNQDTHWYANPFGIRTKHLGSLVNVHKTSSDFSNFELHRDISPCSVGGCVTPEMQRDYLFEQEQKQGTLSAGQKEDLESFRAVKACPFYFRHTEQDLSNVRPNPQRFTQCYVTLPEAMEMMKKHNLIAAAPIFRTLDENISDHSSYWYSFFSGFSFIQFPAIQPDNEGWDTIPFALRWQATTISRQNINLSTKELPITQLFESVKTGVKLSAYEKYYRVFCYSDAYTSIMLLQWLINRRVLASLLKQGQFIDIEAKLNWVFEEYNEDNTGLLTTLSEIGYDLKGLFHISQDSDRIYRRESLLEEDLVLLGLKNQKGEITDRFKYCIKWLEGRFGENSSIDINEDRYSDLSRESFCNFFNPILPGIKKVLHEDPRYQLELLCAVMASAPFVDLPNFCCPDSLAKSPVLNRPEMLKAVIEFETNTLMGICQLLPKVHILVRAYATTPVRWLFIPTSYESDISKSGDNNQTPEIFSGVILLLRDMENSALYDYSRLRTKSDAVFSKLKLLHPLLIAVTNIEEENIRENLIKSREMLEFHKREANPMGHFLKHINMELESIDDDSLHVISLMVNHLERRYRLMAELKNHYKLHERIQIDFADSIRKAIRAVVLFSARHKTRKDIINIDLISKDEVVTGWITPMTGNYEEGEFKKLEIANNDFQLLISDLLFQRIDYKDYLQTITLSKRESKITKGNSIVEIKLMIDQRLSRKVLWKYPEQSIDSLPFGRGFYSTFMRAKNLGAIELEVANELDQSGKLKGVFKLIFEG